MKAIHFAALLLISCSLVKAGVLTCSNYQRQQSGRMIMFMAKVRIDMKPYNLDLDLKRFQSDLMIYANDGSKVMGPYNVIIDYEAAKKYVISKGKCHIMPSSEEIPEISDWNRMTLLAEGKLGLKGAEVGVYAYKKNKTEGILTLENDKMCLPENFAGSTKAGIMSVSYLDTKTTVDPSKFVIPEMCKKAIRRRSVMMDEGIALDIELPFFF